MDEKATEQPHPDGPDATCPSHRDRGRKAVLHRDKTAKEARLAAAVRALPPPATHRP